MKYLLKTLVFLAVSTNGYAAEKDSPVDDTTIFEKNNDITNHIADFLEPRDFIHLSQTNKANNDILSNKPHSIGNRHRELSKYSVTDINSRPFYLEEYLSMQDRIALSKIKNVDLIAKEQPDNFKKLVLKSIPHTPETIENNLESYYQDVVQIQNLVNRLPRYNTPQEKLAAFLYDASVWTQVWDQVWDQVWNQVWDQVGAQVAIQVWDEVEAQVWDQVGAQVWDQVKDQVWAQVKAQVWAQVWAHVRDQVEAQVGAQVAIQVLDQVEAQVGDQVGDQVGAQVRADLSNFDFSSAFRENQLSEVLKPAIEYSFVVNQLASISMLHSQEIRQFIESLKDRFTEEQATNILTNINLPEAPEGNYFVKTQLDILRRHLPTQN